MEKINNFLNKATSPLDYFVKLLVQFCLGISFFLHGYGKIPISQGFIDFLSSKGVPLSNISAYIVAWAEILSGLGLIIGGILSLRSSTLGNLITRFSALTIVIIMINALFIGHSHWSIFIGERGAVLFASEQLFLLVLGLFFLIRGNNN
ncbi:DoxX family protein [Hyphomicrobiales bacterium]|nr:DoxX family protein [Hyphomicrobiales bacterium]